MGILIRKPIVTALVAVLLALIVVDGARQVVDRESRTEHWWPVLVLLVFVGYGVAVFAYFSSELGRAKLTRSGQPPSPEAINFALLAVTICPVIVSIATVFLGAPTWVLWAALAVTCGLLATWVVQVRAGRI